MNDQHNNGALGGRLAALGRLAKLTLSMAASSLPLGLLSFALALVIWVTVTNEENPSIRRALPQEIPIEQVNVPRSLLPTNSNPAKVSVTISGPRSAVNDVRPEDVVARVDLSRVDEEMAGLREATLERSVRVEVRRRGVRAEASPEVVKVTLEQQERRTVPICVEKVDVPPPGFSLEDPVVTDPVEVTITGPRRNIDSVECAAAVLRLTGLTVSVSNQVPLDPRDAAGRAIGGVTVQPSTATVNARIRQDLFPRQLVTDARLQGRPAPGYTVTSVRVEPPLASVVGPLDTVGGLNSVATEVIDIEGSKTDIVRAVALNIPPGVSSGDRRSVVTITIQPVRGPGSIGVAPRITNVGPGLSVTLNTPVVAVFVNGPLPDVLALKPADVTITVDATGLGPGTHRLEPKVVVPAGLSYEGASPERIEIVIGSQP